MKIINNTSWQTSDLRAFVRRVAQDELDAAQRRRLILTFDPARQQRACNGRAFVGGSRAWIYLPTKAEPDKADLASVIAHELAHIRGMDDERSMRASARYGTRDERHKQVYAWAYALPLEHKPPAKKKERPTGETLASKKMQEVEAAIARWTAKKKRAETALRKYRQRQRYYQGRIAAFRANRSDHEAIQ